MNITDKMIEEALRVWFANSHLGWKAAMKAVLESINK